MAYTNWLIYDVPDTEPFTACEEANSTDDVDDLRKYDYDGISAYMFKAGEHFYTACDHNGAVVLKSDQKTLCIDAGHFRCK